MKRNSLGRSALFLCILSAGPLALGCEAILDFDRTPLQPIVEASVVETGPTVPDAGKKDTGKPGDDDDDDDGKKDAGKDASPSKDAGDGGDAGDAGT